MLQGLHFTADLRSMARSMILPNSRIRSSWLSTDGSGRESDRHKGGMFDFVCLLILGFETGFGTEMLAIGFPCRSA